MNLNFRVSRSITSPSIPPPDFHILPTHRLILRRISQLHFHHVTLPQRHFALYYTTNTCYTFHYHSYSVVRVIIYDKNKNKFKIILNSPALPQLSILSGYKPTSSTMPYALACSLLLIFP